jgi:hydrogenase maturation protease
MKAGAVILVIAYGNSLRRDDGAGFVLAEQLDRAWTAQGKQVRRIEEHQLAPELSLDVAAEDVSAVFFVDTRAVAPGLPEASNPEVQVDRIYAADASSPSVGHNLDARAVLTYTKHLFKKEPPAWLVTIPGFDFGHGEGLSEPAQKAIAAAVIEVPASLS